MGPPRKQAGGGGRSDFLFNINEREKSPCGEPLFAKEGLHRAARAGKGGSGLLQGQNAIGVTRRKSTKPYLAAAGGRGNALGKKEAWRVERRSGGAVRSLKKEEAIRLG